MKIEEEIQKLVDEDQIQEALLTLDANEAKIHDKAWYYSERGWILGMLERYQEAFWSLNKALSLGQDVYKRQCLLYSMPFLYKVFL